jgi:hypothetical protein
MAFSRSSRYGPRGKDDSSPAGPTECASHVSAHSAPRRRGSAPKRFLWLAGSSCGPSLRKRSLYKSFATHGHAAPVRCGYCCGCASGSAIRANPATRHMYVGCRPYYKSPCNRSVGTCEAKKVRLEQKLPSEGTKALMISSLRVPHWLLPICPQGYSSKYLFSELIPPQERYLFRFGGSVLCVHGIRDRECAKLWGGPSPTFPFMI